MYLVCSPGIDTLEQVSLQWGVLNDQDRDFYVRPKRDHGCDLLSHGQVTSYELAKVMT